MEILHSVTKAIPRDGLDVEVHFDTGERGVYNCRHLLSDPYWRSLGDPCVFMTAHAEYGTIVWAGNIDVAPESVWEDCVKIR